MAVRRSSRGRAVAPSSTDPASKAAAAAIAAQLRAMTAEHANASAGDVEAIHRLRVATRRLRAGLRMLREVAPGGEAQSTADELAWLCGAIGAVRDLDVLAQLLEDRATRLEPDFIRALEPLSDTIRRQRTVEQERLVAALDSERYRGLAQRLGAVAPQPTADGVTLGALAARLVRPQLRAMLRAVGGKPARRMLRRLERVQERVGMYHDAVSAAAWLHGWAAESRDTPAMAMMAAGALIHSFERRIRRLRTRSLKAWRRTDTDDLARATLDELNQAAAQARRAAKPPLALVPIAHAS